ncbi:hypothetical protein pipiens_013322, partial [Culex pipiens pipiens]
WPNQHKAKRGSPEVAESERPSGLWIKNKQAPCRTVQRRPQESAKTQERVLI